MRFKTGNVRPIARKAERLLSRIRTRSRSREDYWLVRFLFLRILGFTYFFAFLSLVLQLRPLLGSNGLTPVSSYLPPVSQVGPVKAFLELPTLFWFNSSDPFMVALAALGLVISALVLVGFANAPMLFLNWLIYLSFVNAGQVWYGYGWESQLLETGFLAIFMVPLLDPEPFSRDSPPPVPLIWLLRWLGLRVHLGSGLIKLKGVECWEKLTCLERYFETQPIPNPVSPWMHYMPSPARKTGVLLTHAVQVVVPFSVFAETVDRTERGRKIRNWGGVAMLAFQFALIMTGNLSFLNWVTIAAIISFFDDEFLARFLPDRVVRKAEIAKKNATEVSKLREAVNWLLVLMVAALSVPVVVNLVSPAQAMNASFNEFHLVNTYGAFGSVRPGRTEIVVEGRRNGEWREYDFRFKPDQEDDPLPVVAPYQPRIAWQMWFASMSKPGREPWLLHLTWKLLHNDPMALKLVKHNPFPEKPPDQVRIQYYRFSYEKPWRKETWNRELLGTWMPPVSRNSTRLENYLERRY